MSVLNTFFLGRARLVTHTVGWTVIALIFFYALSSFRSPTEALGRTLLNIGFLMALYYINAKILINRFFERGKYWWWISLAIPLWIFTAALRVITEIWIYGGSVLEETIPGQGSRGRAFFIFCFMYFLLSLFSSLYQFLENRYDMEIRNRELSVKHKEAQLNFLKTQINPHFIFNTLNNIYAAATLNHPRTAEMVLKLSELLRFVTYDTQSDKLPLKREWKIIHSVIALYTMRTASNTHVTADVEGDIERVSLEPMLLLPIVENALKHGNLEDDPNAFVHIRLQIENQTLRFEVINTFDPQNLRKDHDGGVGLANIRNRLELNYPGEYWLDISNDSKVYKVLLTINTSW